MKRLTTKLCALAITLLGLTLGLVACEQPDDEAVQTRPSAETELERQDVEEAAEQETDAEEGDTGAQQGEGPDTGVQADDEADAREGDTGAQQAQ